MHIFKYSAVANVETEDGITLHREMEFATEAEVDAFIAANPDEGYEKIPFWKED